MPLPPNKVLFRIRALIAFFMFALIVSGITAFPVETELHCILQHSGWMPQKLSEYLNQVYDGIKITNAKFPFIAYGFDWLAFAHLVIAMVFIGPFRNPVKNIWVIEWAMLCCIAIIPLAFICGPIRGIPLYWTLVDCSFGVFGIFPLWLCRRWILQL